MKNIKPDLPGGFQDYLPHKERARTYIISTIKSVFEKFGFMPMSTPAVEKRDVLTGGDANFDKELFEIKRIKEKDELALRFDLTVPLARVVATYPQDIKLPLRRYQIGNAWRGEKPQRGRYREFLQCDADIVGSSSFIADAEIITLINEAMTALEVDFEIRVNNRKIFSDLSPEILRSVDKLDKQGWKAVQSELRELGLNEDKIEGIKSLIELKSLKDAKSLIPDNEGVLELEKLAGYLRLFEVPDKNYSFDFSVARGLGYYTGTVYETTLKKLPKIGSVASGGRYDNLIGKFSGSDVAAVGVSFGVDRLLAGMQELHVFDNEGAGTVLVLNFSESTESDVLRIAKTLRDADIPTDIYLGNEDNLKGQMAYATAASYPVLVIIGPQEKQKNIVQVRDMAKRKQFETNENNIIEKILEALY